MVGVHIVLHDQWSKPGVANEVLSHLPTTGGHRQRVEEAVLW